MSYDIYLLEPATRETIELPIKHMMTGGTYRADFDPATGTFSPAAISEAHLNITYNYSSYYYEATEGDERFANKEYGDETSCGIRGIYGKTGLESIQMLTDMISRIEEKYKKDGEWITRKRTEVFFYDPDGNTIHPVEALVKKIEYTKVEKEIEVDEGATGDYWYPTAANAVRPLYQLLVFARLRPDGIWDGD